MYKRIAITMFEKFGFNILPLRGKRPVIEWDKWQTEKQSKDDIESMPWGKSTGLGAVMGNDDLRLFDVDGIEDYELLDLLLNELGLPEKYTWVVQSGSGEGFHIYFLCKYETEVFQKLGGEKAVYKFKLKQDGLCKHIELRWKDCQTALPPSMHESSGMYSFYYKEPLEAPEYVASEKVVDCLLNLCDTTTIKKSTSKTEAKKQYIDREKLESALDYLSEHLPEGSYEEWYRIGFALVPLGEEGENYFIKMSLDNPNYSDTETVLRKKFEELTKEYDGSVTLGTIFHIAEVQGWKKPVIKFWKVEKNGNVNIIRTRYKRFLESEGFCKYKIDANYLFVRITDNIVEEIESIAVKDFVLDYLYGVPMDEFDEINRSDVIDALIKGVNQFFTNQFLEFLITRRINFNKDTKESSFIYYSNGFAEVNEKRVQFKDYKQLNGRIWKRQIRDRKYNEAKSRSDFEEFLFNVCGKDKNRFAALKSGIGFALHSYKDPNRAKAVIFLDERLSEGAFGRSGKGLLIKAIGHIRNIVTEESRNFNPSKNFAFQRVTADTNIIAFEDLREKFPFDRLFSIITDGLTVEKKNKDEIFIPFSEAPKIIVSSNYSIKGVDDSTVDRQFTIEFSDHYNMKHRPFDEFGKMFFNGWDEEEWNAFYDFMIECLQYYLKNGLVEYEYVNLERKRLIDETCDEFAEFSEEIQLDFEYNKKELCEQFKSEYDDFEKLHQSKFTRWLKLWARIKDYDVLEGKSGVNRTIIFKTLKKAA